jgi:tetratricopeptide (TPR) repeat protein
VRCLQRAVAMAPGDAQARRLLGEVLYRIGAVHGAMEHLQKLQELDPQDAELQTLLAHVQGLADRGDDIDGLLEDVEAHGSLAHPSLAAVPKPQGDEAMARVRDGLAHVADLAGVRKATFIRGSKALVKGAQDDAMPALASGSVGAGARAAACTGRAPCGKPRCSGRRSRRPRLRRASRKARALLSRTRRGA